MLSTIIKADLRSTIAIARKLCGLRTLRDVTKKPTDNKKSVSTKRTVRRMKETAFGDE